MDWFDAFAKEFAVYGYPVLFAGVLLENAGIPVPGETAVLVAGFLSSPAGGGHFNVLWVILITLLAAVLGDNVGFWLGRRWARVRLQQGRRFLFLTPKALELAEGYFHRYGVWTIFFARFITGLRVVGALAAGTAGMPWPRFLVANAGGALAWSITMSLLGYFFGHSWELLHKWLRGGALIILGCVILLVGLPYLLRRLHKLRIGFWDRLAHVQVWQGLLVAILEVICVGILVRLAQGERATEIDKHIHEWIGDHSLLALNVLAAWGSFMGTLVVVAAVALLALLLLWYQGRSWRESAAVLWALVASEAIGLLLIALLRFQDIEYVQAVTWPFGFAGLVPVRAFAVFGMVSRVLGRQNRRAGRLAACLASILVLWATFGVVWTHTQLFSEALLECAAGGLILFTAVWWLEGYGPGLLSSPEHPEPTPPDSPLADRHDPASAAKDISHTVAQR